MLLLVQSIGIDAFGLVDGVGVGQVEQGAGGDADDEFLFDGVGHERLLLLSSSLDKHSVTTNASTL
ncbi:hypothetical protein D3C76_1632510 [compost metagenome]